MFRSKSFWLFIGLIFGFFLRPTITDRSNPTRRNNSETGNFNGGKRTVSAGLKDVDTSPNSTIIQKVEVDSDSPNNPLLSLPLSIVKKLPFRLLFDSSGQLDPACLLAYGLGIDEAVRLTEKINSSVIELKTLELENSQLVETENGDQYFQLNRFPEKGTAVKKRLDEFLEKELSQYPDDRKILVQVAIENSNPFNGFGKYSRQIWFEESVNKDGSKEWLPKQKLITDKMIIDNSILSKNSPATKKLLDSLISKHLKDKN